MLETNTLHGCRRGNKWSDLAITYLALLSLLRRSSMFIAQHHLKNWSSRGVQCPRRRLHVAPNGAKHWVWPWAINIVLLRSKTGESKMLLPFQGLAGLGEKSSFVRTVVVMDDFIFTESRFICALDNVVGRDEPVCQSGDLAQC